MSPYWEGLSAFEGALREAALAKTRGARRGLGLAARNVLTVSNRQVPHEDGDLERDGAASVDDGKLIAAVSYGRRADTKAYAVVQHERLDYQHDGGRNAKFLERAFNSERDTTARIIAQATKEDMGT